MNEHDAAIQDLIDAGLVLEQQRHGDMTRGHVSVRVPGRPEWFLMKPHGIGFGEITRENLLTLDLDGERVAGAGRPHSERFIHSEIFRARPDIACVIHTHPVHSIAFAATGQRMRALSQVAATFHDALPVFAETIRLIRSPEAGRAVAACLGPHNAVLLRGHGVAMAGATVAEAVVLCVSLEEAARIQLLAAAAGLDGWEYPVEEIRAIQENFMRPAQFKVNFDYLVRQSRLALRR